MMKKLSILLAICMAVCLAGCRSSAGTLPEPAAEETAAPGALPPADQITGISVDEVAETDSGLPEGDEEYPEFQVSDGGFTAPTTALTGKLTQNGKEQDTYIVITGESITFFADEKQDYILGYADLPEAVRELEAEDISLDLIDLDSDGWSDICLNLTYPDGTTASLLWIWNRSEGYAFNPEMSILPGEVPARGE